MNISSVVHQLRTTDLAASISFVRHRTSRYAHRSTRRVFSSAAIFATDHSDCYGLMYELTEETDVEAVQAAVLRGIRDPDPMDVGTRDYRPLAMALRAPDATVIGGLHGATMWKWLMVDGLWVADE